MAGKKKKKSKKSDEVAQEPVAVEEPVNGDFDELEPVDELSREDTLRAVYALLFASDRPLSVGRITEALGDIDPDVVANLLGELETMINDSPSPYSLREIAGGYQLMTDAAFAPFIRRLFKLKKSNKLSKTVLETLAIIAYRQPVTRPDVESIRGVSVSHAFNTLQERKLIKAVGVADAPGRPRLYRTTDEFLVHFGISSVKELPSIEELREMS